MKTKRSGLKVLYCVLILMPLIGLINSFGIFVLLKSIGNWQEFYWKIWQHMQSYTDGFVDGFFTYIVICIFGFASFAVLGLHLCNWLGFSIVPKGSEDEVSHLTDYDVANDRQRIADIVNSVKSKDYITLNRQSDSLTYNDFKNSVKSFSNELCSLQNRLHDSTVKHNVAEIAKLSRLILENTDDTEYNKGNLRRLPLEYIPTVQHLIQAYAGLNTKDTIDTEEVIKTKEIVSDALAKIVVMFENLLKESMEQDLLNIQVDTSVLLQKAELNGLYNQNDITRCRVQNK